MLGVSCLVDGALRVLSESDPWAKRTKTEALVALWKSGSLPAHDGRTYAVPDRPERCDNVVKIVASGAMPKLGKGGTLASRQAILHSLTHIESWAVDLAWDIIARFGQNPTYKLPHSFFDDFVAVAADECRHFALLAARLQDIGSHYGAFPAHDGLWESAAATAHSLPARLAVEHCVHEARGLDVLPCTIRRLRASGDATSANLLEGTVYPDEVTHVAAGVRWLRHLHDVATGAPAALAVSQGGSEGKEGSHAGVPAAAAGGVRGAGSSGSARPAAGSERGEAGHAAATGGDDANVVLVEAAGCGGTTPVTVLEVRGVMGRTVAAHGASAVDTFVGQMTPPAKEATLVERCTTAADVRTFQATGAGAAGGGDWRQQAVECGSVEVWFHALIRSNFCGSTKPPFNAEARSLAGFTEGWYLPLATPSPAS